MNYDRIIAQGLPEHIAIILDGNGRWAKKRGLPRTIGHRNGAYNLEKIANICNDIGIKALTVYAFSTENWNRPQKEVDYLMKAPVRYFKRNIDKVVASNIKINFIGRKDRIPQDTLEVMRQVIDKTKNNQGLVLNIAFDYGGKTEILDAFKEIYHLIEQGELKIDDVNEQVLEKHLYTKDSPPLDLLIRTSGEKRISNFLLWQLSYAELYFTDCYWPDFDKEELFKAIESYQGRKRRFGGLNKEDER